MKFKEKFSKGNNFILSPFGTIKPIRYAIYAFILEILYKLSFGITTALQKDIPIIGLLLFLITLIIIVLKGFNYKKRFQDFTGNTIISSILTLIYMFIGFALQEYAYLTKLKLNKEIYDLTLQAKNLSDYQSTFQQYANTNIPNFIGTDACNIIFYIITAIGIIMFLFLLFKPSKTIQTSDIETTEKEANKKVENKIYNKNYITTKILKKRIIIPSLILYIILLGFSYSEIHWRAYKWMFYFPTNEQVDYVNNLEKIKYETDIIEYENSQIEWHDCLKKHPDISERLMFCENSPKINTKPEIPNYYIYGKGYLGMASLSYFNCNEDNFSLFNNKCGDIKFDGENRTYDNFHPYLLLILALTLLLPISTCICLIIEKILVALIATIKKINLKNLKHNFPKFFARKQTLSDKLQELNSLKEQGLITEEDYNLAKKNLLNDFK